MLAEMRPTELSRWLALMQIEPWGAYRDDLRAGYVAAALAPAWLKKHSGGGFAPSDFMPDFSEQPTPSAAKPNQTLRAFLDGMSAKSPKP